MSFEMKLSIILGVLAAALVVMLILRKAPKRVKVTHYIRKWREVQHLCANKETWVSAIVNADELLDEVLKKKRFVGKTMGERMVNAQVNFTVHDAVWSAHKLANTLRQKDVTTVDENDVKEALIAFRQALRDLGAIG